MAIPGGGESSLGSCPSSSSIVKNIGWLTFLDAGEIVATSSLFWLLIETLEEYVTDVVVVGEGLDRGMIPKKEGLIDCLLCDGFELMAVTILSDDIGLTTVVNKLLPHDIGIGDLIVILWGLFVAGFGWDWTSLEVETKPFEILA